MTCGPRAKAPCRKVGDAIDAGGVGVNGAGSRKPLKQLEEHIA